jgi:glycine hydroxymethyltransferase
MFANHSRPAREAVPRMNPTPTDAAYLRELLARLRSASDAGKAALSLVPSENRLSPMAQAPLQLDFYNRYFFNENHDPAFWEFRGGEDIADIETEVAHRSLSALSAAPFVNVRPTSGLNAMTIAISALGGAVGNTVVSVDESSGGHYATTSVIRRLGFTSATVAVEAGAVDVDCLAKLLATQDISLVYLDLQNSLHDLDIASVAACITEHSPGTHLHVDCSHTLGLVLGGAIANPLDMGATSWGGSTHKTFPGPHKGVLFTREESIRDLVKSAQYVLLSSHHFAETLALGIAAREFEYFGAAYAKQVIANARQLGTALAARGFDVARAHDGVTDTHQVWVNIGDRDSTLKFSETLARAGIRVNVLPGIPGIPGSAFRLGTNEVTFTGATPVTMELIADAFLSAHSGFPGQAKSICKLARETFSSPYHFEDEDF